MKNTYKLLFSLAVSLFTVNLSYAQIVHIDTFTFTSSIQDIEIPSCVSQIEFDIRGAKGGDQRTAKGGKGGRVTGILPVSEGDKIYISVGEQGFNDENVSSGGFGGGGGVESYISGLSGTGGGASDIRLNGNTLNDRVIVAGGGGGAGGSSSQFLGGGNGGDTLAEDGAPWNTWVNGGGKGGGQSMGGSQGVACCQCPTYTKDGILGQGGIGSGDAAGGGGGGGGYYGGGGSCFGAGGGGSSYTDPNAKDVVHVQGYNEGQGMVIITYTEYPAEFIDIVTNACDEWTSPSGIVINNSGLYRDTVPSSVGGCDTFYTISLTINTVDDATEIVDNRTLRAKMNSASYQWIDCADNSYISGATLQEYHTTTIGIFAVEVNNQGCIDTSDCVVMGSVGLLRNDFGTEITYSPNPTKGDVNIELDAPFNNLNIEVFNSLGQKVSSNEFKQGEPMQIHVEGAKGVYIIHLTSDEGKVAQLKILKE